MSKRLWIAIVLGCAAVLAVLLLRYSSSDRAFGRNGEPALTRTVAAERGDIRLVISADGQVEAINIVEIKSKASGEIIHLPWESGDRVREGEVLAQLDPTTAKTTLRQAEADLEVAKAKVELMKKTLERKRKLLEKGLISEEDYDRAVLDSRQAEAELVSAETRKENADEKLKDTTVRAPISGIILEKRVEEGQIIASGVSLYSAGTTLLSLADLSKVRVVANIDETDVGRIHEGVDVTITVDAYPQEVFHGKVLKIEPRAVLEQNVITFPVVTEITNPSGKLLPGMSAEMEVVADERRQVVCLPSEAVYDTKSLHILAAELGVDLPEAQTGNLRAPSTAKPDGGKPIDPRSPKAGEVSPGRQRRGLAAPPGGRFHAEGAGGRAAGAAFSNSRFAPRYVLLEKDGKLEARRVLTGLDNYEKVEILKGIEEGDRVLLVTQSRALQDQQRFKERFRQMRGMPGTKKS